ncbi:MAG: hypothetical protein ACE366_03375 [Bradymonadia bacterium]
MNVCLKLWALLSLAGALGCTTVGAPRPADVAPPVGVSSEIYIPVHTLAFGEAKGTEGPPVDRTGDTVGEAKPLTIKGHSGGVAVLHPLAYLFPSWEELSLRVGVFEPCEIGGSAGLLRQGAELRCGITQRRWGDSMSLAISGGITHRVDLLQIELPNQGVGWRAGLEGSGPLFEDEDNQWMLGLWLSRGPHSHGISNIPSRLDEGTDLHMGPSLYIQRMESRLTVPMAVGLGEGRNGFMVGLSPYFTVDAGPAEFECDQCSRAHMETFTERWGVSLLVGGYFGSEGAIIDFDEPEPLKGHHIEWRSDKDTIVGGKIMSFVGYTVPLIPSMVISLADESPFPWWVLVPVVGDPLVAAGVGDSPLPTRIMAGFGGAVQGIGVITWLIGWRGSPQQIPDESSVWVVPMTNGAAVAGRF